MAATNSYIQDDSGTYIPATQRPDGSWRKARRVKDGYIPQDEMPLYESKGKQWAKSRPTLPIGLDPSYAIQTNAKSSSKTIPGLSISNNETSLPTKSSKKKKKKKSDSPKVLEDLTSDIGKMNVCESNESDLNVSKNSSQKSQPVTTDPAKRLRNLKKKIRDINSLKAKIDSGELTSPDKDQLEKIARKEAIEAEIEELEIELELS